MHRHLSKPCSHATSTTFRDQDQRPFVIQGAVSRKPHARSTDSCDLRLSAAWYGQIDGSGQVSDEPPVTGSDATTQVG